LSGTDMIALNLREKAVEMRQIADRNVPLQPSLRPVVDASLLLSERGLSDGTTDPIEQMRIMNLQRDRAGAVRGCLPLAREAATAEWLR
jgi:hypothetical protein